MTPKDEARNEAEDPANQDHSRDEIPAAVTDQSFAETETLPGDAAPPADPVEKEPAYEPHVPKSQNNKRLEMARSIEAKRREEAGEPPAPIIDEEPVERAADAPKRKLKVNGAEVELSDEEVIANAQKYLAQGHTLEELKTLKRLTQEQLAEIQKYRQTAQPQPTDPPANQRGADRPAQSEGRAKPVLDDTALEAIAEKIQVGDAKEGAAALREVIESVAVNQQPVDVQGLSRQVASDLQRANAEAAGRRFFQEQYPDINDDRLMTMAFTEQFNVRAVQEIAKLNIPPEAKALAARNPNVAAAWYGEYVTKGLPVRQPHDLAKEAVTAVRQKYLGGREPARQDPRPASPGPAAETAARTAEKRSTLIAQPRRASVVARQPQGPPVPKTRTEIVDSMRSGRGLKPLV